jgi:tripeptidyl-peptidase-1
MWYILTALLVAAGGVLAKGTDCHYKLKETVPSPRDWTKQGIPSPEHNINLRIGLPQANFPLLEQHLYEISNPRHERYGQHLSKEEVEALVAPHQESLDSVDKWIASFGIKDDEIQRSPARDWVKLRIPVRLAEEMLNTVCVHCWEPLLNVHYLHCLDIFRMETPSKWRLPRQDDKLQFTRLCSYARGCRTTHNDVRQIQKFEINSGLR